MKKKMWEGIVVSEENTKNKYKKPEKHPSRRTGVSPVYFNSENLPFFILHRVEGYFLILNFFVTNSLTFLAIFKHSKFSATPKSL
jgi:hypothetical protein